MMAKLQSSANPWKVYREKEEQKEQRGRIGSNGHKRASHM